MAEQVNSPRPISCASTRIPSQTGLRAAFSRPVTAALNSPEEGDWEETSVDEGETIDDVLITQLKEAISDPPLENRIRFRRCQDRFDESAEEPVDVFDDVGWDTDLENDDETDTTIQTLPQLYISVCRKLNVVPVSRFLKHMEDTVLDLKHRALIAAETAAIAKAFKSVLSIESLDLGGNDLGDKGCEYLCEMLKDNHILRTLSIAENNLSDASASHINRMLAENDTLKELSLAGNLFTDNSAATFADFMEDCKLKSLDLSHNRFGARGGVILGPALSTNVYLDELDLSWNQIRGAGAVAVATGLKENVHIAVCNLAWNGFSELGGLALADALLVNTNLKEIDISSNRLTYPVAVKLAKVLGTNEVLETLKMANNPISTNGCLVIVEALYKSTASVLQFLDLSENPVEYEFERISEALVERKPKLQIFSGPILRAGNTDQDIGKPAIDIVRLRQKPVMILKGSLTVNKPLVLFKHLKKIRVTSTCTAEQLTQVLQVIDARLTSKQISEAIEKLTRNEKDRIIVSEIPGVTTSTKAVAS
ncbi:leucine-rich repeat-containing protein 74B-like [Watersipora subatra]|uniref:leucine-rich repeat-containing protein 74B-like n=1 Tax=Watersipora subatra TaxID=2589382 RepID=UPI00355B8D29